MQDMSEDQVADVMAYRNILINDPNKRATLLGGLTYRSGYDLELLKSGIDPKTGKKFSKGGSTSNSTQQNFTVIDGGKKRAATPQEAALMSRAMPPRKVMIDNMVSEGWSREEASAFVNNNFRSQ